MAGEKYVLHNKHITPEDGIQTHSFDFSEKEEVLLAIDAARRASLEYEDMVQDVDTRFYEKMVAALLRFQHIGVIMLIPMMNIC